MGWVGCCGPRWGLRGPVAAHGRFHRALLGSRVQVCVTLLVTLEVGVQVVHCGEPPHREREDTL